MLTRTSNALLSRDVTKRSKPSHWPASFSTNNSQCQLQKTYKRWTGVCRTPSPFFTLHHLDHSIHPTVCLRWLHVEYAVGERNTWGAFPVRKEGPCGVWKCHGTGASLDLSLAITQLTPPRSERSSLTVPRDVLTLIPSM